MLYKKIMRDLLNDFLSSGHAVCTAVEMLDTAINFFQKLEEVLDKEGMAEVVKSVALVREILIEVALFFDTYQGVINGCVLSALQEQPENSELQAAMPRGGLQ